MCKFNKKRENAKMELKMVWHGWYGATTPNYGMGAIVVTHGPYSVRRLNTASLSIP